MKTNVDGAEAIFYEAIELGETSREAFLNEVCGDDRGVREEVDGLVADHARAGDFLEKPAARIPADDHSPMAERPGMIIGPYKLMGQIGEGGFGLVFVAEQRQPLRRKVALKIIKPGMDTKQVIARFEAERQALAMMDHPNIAKVLDAGETETGRPYFVMELVRGESVTEYCDRNNLSISQRLEIFRRVCGAVQHAHQKGVIHRDIKPSNVLITTHDDKPLPKVIDFGIAKATRAPLTQKTLFTDRDQLIGTPDYTSPEQAGAIAADIDTRSDIYSLGVLLYELLTGTTPFDSQALRAAGYEEMLRIIREVEPPKPSSRLSTMGQNLLWVARHRREDPERLGTIVRGDLDCIVVKALEKDRTRRYETAAELADDILNYLQGDPVNATPPSRAYRLRKFARKHRGPVIAGTLIAAAMAIATVSSAAFGTAALHARNLMNKALLAQAAETKRARSAEADAMRLAQELEQFAFVVQEVSNTEVVDARRWERTVDLLLSREPMALTPANTARVAVLRGAVQLRLDRPAEAIEHFRNGLAAWHEAWDDHRFADLRTLHTATIGIQALVRSDAVASRDEARELIEHVIRAWRSIDPKYPDDYDRIGIFLAGEALTRLGDDETAEPLLRESAQRLGETPRYQDWLGKAANKLASLLDRTGRQAEAQELREREQQRRIEAERKGKPNAAAIARSAAAKAAKLVAGESPTEAMEALHRSLEAWHAAWDNHRFADLETLGSVTDAAVAIAVGASKVDAKEVGNVLDLVVKAWETLRHKYPPDFAHLGLIPAGAAMMARGENAKAQCLLEQAEGVLDASSRYKEWHRWCVELLADVTARRGDDDRAAEWTRKLQLLAPSNKERPPWPWAASAQ